MLAAPMKSRSKDQTLFYRNKAFDLDLDKSMPTSMPALPCKT